MRREESPIEARLADAVRAAAGIYEAYTAIRGLDGLIGKSRIGSLLPSSGVASSAHQSLIEALAATKASPNPSAHADLTQLFVAPGAAVAAAVASLVGNRPATTVSGLKGIVSHFNPLLGGLFRLFGSSPADPAAPLPVVARPARAHYELGFHSGNSNYYMVDREESGLPRATAPIAAPTVVVNVEAVDTRSFLDRTPEIAEAIRRALLESEGMQSLISSLRE